MNVILSVRLRQSGIKIKFVSNTTKEPLRTLHERLSKLGFDIKKEEIFTSLTAARNLVDTRNIRPLLMLEEIAKEDFIGTFANSNICNMLPIFMYRVTVAY